MGITKRLALSFDTSSDDESISPSRSSHCSDCSLVSYYSSSNNESIDMTHKMTDEHEIAGATAAKRFKASSSLSTSIDMVLSSKHSTSTPTTSNNSSKKNFHLTEIDYNLPKFQPKLKNVWLSKKEIHEYLHPKSNKSTENDISTQLRVESKENMVTNLNIQNETDIEIIQTNCTTANTSNRVNKTHQRDPQSIDYKSWQWQPKLRISNLSKHELKKKLNKRYRQNENNNSDIQLSGTWLQINPIQFDKEQSLIEELSPRQATEQFEKRLSAIKKSQELGSAHTNAVAGVSRSRKRSFELSFPGEVSKKPPKGKPGIRKLFSPHNLNENADSINNNKKRSRRIAGLDIGGIPKRTSKKLLSLSKMQTTDS